MLLMAANLGHIASDELLCYLFQNYRRQYDALYI